MKKIKETLKTHERRISDLEKTMEKILEKKTLIVDSGSIIKNSIQKLSKDANITENKIRGLVNPEKLILTVVIKGKKESEKQLKASLVLLTMKKYFYNSNIILSEDLRKKLKRLGIKSLINLPSNLSKHPQYIICNIVSGSRKSTYEVTVPGIKRGIEIIKELVES